MDFIEPCFGTGHNLSLICQMISEDIKHQLIIIISAKTGTKEADSHGRPKDYCRNSDVKNDGYDDDDGDA